jgi:hypothetical protein
LAVADAQLGNTGLAPDAHRVALAGPIERLEYPPLCPNCGGAASEPLPITKVFQHIQVGGSTGWRYRMATATPLFCRACLDRHRAEASPVTPMDALRSLFLTELALPAVGLAGFGLFLLHRTGARAFRDLPGQWPILAVIGAFLLLATLCLRAAWTGNAHRRVPRGTETSRAFDFGDDGDTAFGTAPRSYAIRNADYAAAFSGLNAERSAALLGPAQRRRTSRAFWVTAAIIAGLVILARYLGLS